jgi:hypothetical protein
MKSTRLVKKEISHAAFQEKNAHHLDLLTLAQSSQSPGVAINVPAESAEQFLNVPSLR